MKAIMAPLALLLLIAASAAADKPSTQLPITAPVYTTSWALSSVDRSNAGTCRTSCGAYFMAPTEATPPTGTYLCRFTVSSSQAVTAGVAAGVTIFGREGVDADGVPTCLAAGPLGVISATRGVQTYGCSCCGTINRVNSGRRYGAGCALTNEIAPVGAQCNATNALGTPYTYGNSAHRRECMCSSLYPACSRVCALCSMCILCSTTAGSHSPGRSQPCTLTLHQFAGNSTVCAVPNALVGGSPLWGYVTPIAGGFVCNAVGLDGLPVSINLAQSYRFCYIQLAYTPALPRDRKADRG